MKGVEQFQSKKLLVKPDNAIVFEKCKGSCIPMLCYVANVPQLSIGSIIVTSKIKHKVTHIFFAGVFPTKCPILIFRRDSMIKLRYKGRKVYMSGP